MSKICLGESSGWGTWYIHYQNGISNKMWRTDLVVSYKQYIFVTLFYLFFIVVLVLSFEKTYFDSLIFISVILLIVEWWRACCYFKRMRGELALFIDINELYWSRERWHIMKKPLFLRYAVVIHLSSKRRGKKQILFLMDDSFSSQDWRSLHYFLRQFIGR